MLKDNLKLLMQEKNITEIELQEALSIPLIAIYKIKNGELSNPSSNVAIKMAKYFNVSVEKLLS